MSNFLQFNNTMTTVGTLLGVGVTPVQPTPGASAVFTGFAVFEHEGSVNTYEVTNQIHLNFLCQVFMDNQFLNYKADTSIKELQVSITPHELFGIPTLNIRRRDLYGNWIDVAQRNGNEISEPGQVATSPSSMTGNQVSSGAHEPAF